ncbi:MAG: hypothetical protein AB7U18_00925 [Dehalococcoidia bacterium]
MGNDDQQQRREQVKHLLRFPSAGPLGPSAIGMNLGISEQELHQVLEELVREGRLIRTRDGRLAASPED